MTRPGLRSLAISAGVGVGVTLAVGGLALLLGFGIPLVVWMLAGLVIGVATWWLRGITVPDETDRVAEPRPTDIPTTGQLDRRTRVLESQLRGAQSGRDMTVSALHATIAEIAARRRPSAPYPPNLAAYLNTEPRALSRAQLRAVLRELTRL